MLTPLPVLPPLPLPSPSVSAHPLPPPRIIRGPGWIRAGRGEEKGGVEGKRVLIPVAITHRRRLVAFNKNVNMAA